MKRHFSPMIVPLYILTALFTLLPLIYVVAMSFMTKGERWGVEAIFTLDNYIAMAQPVYGSVFVDSLKLAGITTGLTLLISYPFAYFTALMPPKWRNTVLLLLVIPFWTNSLVRIYAILSLLGAQGPVNGILMAMGLIEEPAKLLYRYETVVVGMVYGLMPFMILGIYNSVEKLDWQVIEASRDLGAGRIRSFFTMTLPLTLPGILAGCVLVFVPSIGLFFISDVLGGGKVLLLGNLIKNEMHVARNWPFGASLSVAMLALSMIFLTLYRRFSGDKSLEGLL